MKKLLITFSLLIINFSFGYSQSWLWGRQGVGGRTVADEGISIATDSKGNIYETGFFQDTLAFSTDKLYAASAYNMFLVKYNSNGNVLWVKQSKCDLHSQAAAFAVACDKNCNVYVAGYFQDTIIIGPDTLRKNGTDIDAFLVKYDSNGNFLWARQSVCNNNIPLAQATGVTTDNAGYVYLTGTFRDTASFGSITLKFPYDAYGTFLVKYDNNGNVIWVQQSQAGPDAEANAVATDKDNNIFICGYFQDSARFGSFNLASTGIDAFITKYDSSGNVLWARQSVCGYALASALIADTNGNACFTGYYAGNATFNTYPVPASGLQSVFLVKYDPSGNVLWAEAAKDLYNMGWWGRALTSDHFNNVYLAAGATGSGLQYGISFGGDSTLYTYGGTDPAVLVEFDSTGKMLCGSIIASGGDDEIGLASNANNIYFGSDLATSVVFGKDTLGIPSTEWPFIACWKPCCSLGLMQSSGSTSLCKGAVDTLSVWGATNYAWSNGSTSSAIICTLNSDTSFTVKSSNGWCKIDTTVSLSVINIVDSVSHPKPICPGDSVQLWATGGTSYLWEHWAGLSSHDVSSPMAQPTSTTTYTVTINKGGCQAKDSVTVEVINLAAANVCCDTVLIKGQDVQLSASGGVGYSWSPSAGLSCDTCEDPVVAPEQSTTYTLTIMRDSGCVTVETVTVEVQCGNVFIPDAFSPNGDGQNDILYVRGACIKTMDIVIYDRWGNKMFESQNQSVGWDGKYRGQPMNTDTYVYYLTGTMTNGSTVDKKGTVELVR